MKILVAPDSFKGSLRAVEFGEIVQRAIHELDPTIRVDTLPLADGGEGTLEALLASLHLVPQTTRVTGPLGMPVDAPWGLSRAGKMAVMEMASASGLTLIPASERNPLKTTSLGTGTLLAAALDAGVEEIVLGIGGSATNDGGAGLLRALGFGLLDAEGKSLRPGAEGLPDLAELKRGAVHPRLPKVRLRVACDVINPLLGPQGASAVYGPQKGATASMQPLLEAGLKHFADAVEALVGEKFRDRPGAGAAGGMGFALMSLCGAELQSGFDLIVEILGLRERLAQERYDGIISGEGRLDAQSSQGKLLSRLGRLAEETGTPVLALAGSIADDASDLPGISRRLAISPPDMDVASAMAAAPRLLHEAVQSLMKKGKLF